MISVYSCSLFADEWVEIGRSFVSVRSGTRRGNQSMRNKQTKSQINVFLNQVSCLHRSDLCFNSSLNAKHALIYNAICLYGFLYEILNSLSFEY